MKNIARHLAPIIAATSLVACGSDNIDASHKGAEFDINKILVTYVEPGKITPIDVVQPHQKAAYDSVPDDGNNSSDSSADTVKLGINSILRIGTDFSSGKNGDTPKEVCITLLLPPSTKALGAVASGNYGGDFVAYTKSDGAQQEGMICYDPENHAQSIAVVALSSVPER